MTDSADSPYFLPDQAAEYLHVTTRKLADMRQAGTGPRYRKHGSRVVYTVAAIEEWSARRERGSTSEKPRS